MEKYLNLKVGKNLLLITLGHIALTFWALNLVAPPENISLMWLPDGYLLGCLVLLPRTLWLPLCLLILGGTWLTELLMMDRPNSLILSFATANFLESIGGAWLFQRFSGGKSGFSGYRHLTAFILFAAMLLPGFSALIGAGSLVLHGYTDQFWFVYKTWLFSAGLGNLFVAPLVIYGFSFLYGKNKYGTTERQLPKKGSLVYSPLWLTALLAFLGTVLPYLLGDDIYAKSISIILTLPLLIWASVRFGMLGAVVVSSVTVISSIQLMTWGLGSFFNAHTSLSAAVVELQSYLGASIIASFFTALTVEKNNKHADALKDTSVRLKELFEYSPVSLWVEDFSSVKQHIDQALEGSTLNLRQWLDQNPEQLPILVQKVVVLSVNQRSLELFGADSEQELIQNLNNIFNDASLLAFKEELISLYELNGQFSTEAVQLKIDGSPIFTSTNVVVSPAHKNDWGRVIVAVEDISARKKAENAIDHFFDQPMNLHLIARFDGTVLRINKGWERFLAYGREELEGRSLLDFVHPDDIESTLAKMSGLQNGGSVDYFENRYRHKVSGYRWLAWSAVSSLSEGLIYAVASDITERKEAESSLQDSAEIFRSTAEGIVLTELDGSIRDANQAFTDITGYSKKEVLGQHIRMLQSGQHDKEFYKEMWQSINETGNWTGEIWNRRNDGSVYPEYLAISSVKNDQGDVTRYVGIFSDITHIKRSEERLSYLSTHDPLTGLANRSLLMEHLERALKHAARNNSILAVLLIDIDGFKHINDSLGPDAGDKLLVEFSQRLSSAVRSDDTVARISGDEFVVIYEDIHQVNSIAHAVEDLMEEFVPPYIINDKELHITVSVGISLYPNDGDKGDMLIRNADAAMFRAKESGRNNYQFYTEALTATAFEHMFIESSLRNALQQNEFRLVYQPQFDFKSKQLIGLEALLRWHSPSRGLIPPGKFIPIAEQSGFMREIGNWVLLQACYQGKEWLDQGYEFGRIAVNVAGPQIMHGDLIEQVSLALDKSGLPASCLELEVTENFVMTEIDSTVAQLQALRDMGIELAIDDFGTGHSSLSYLKQLPINKLKIDQSFVREIHENSSDLAIAEAIIAMAKALDLKTIAEGVETTAQADLLIARECLQAQGYLYSKPISPEEVVARFLKDESNLA